MFITCKSRIPVLNIFDVLALLGVGRDSSVGIATGYWPDCPGIECRWGRDSQYPSTPALLSYQAPVQWVTGVSRR